MTTTLTVRNAVGDAVSGVLFPNPLESLANGSWRYFNRGGKVRIVLYMPASSTFVLTVTSVPDKFGRSKDLTATIATAGANPEIRVLGPYTPGLFNQGAGANEDYVLFTVASLTGAVKAAALYG